MLCSTIVRNWIVSTRIHWTLTEVMGVAHCCIGSLPRFGRVLVTCVPNDEDAVVHRELFGDALGD